MPRWGLALVCLSLRPSPPLWTVSWSCLALPQELWFSSSILLSFYEDKCYGNYFYHWAKNSIEEKQQPGWKSILGLPKHRDSNVLSSFTIISLARSKGVVLNGGWPGMWPVKSKFLELGCRRQNCQSSPDLRLRSSNRDQWPSTHSRVFQSQHCWHLGQIILCWGGCMSAPLAST